MIVARTKSVDDTRELAAHVAPLVRSGDLVLLVGELGAGKTAFVQGLARGLDVDEQVTSPSFTLLRGYDGSLRLLHIDVYRLDHLQEIADLGIVELVDDDDAVAVVEWGDKAEPVLPADFLEIRISFGEDDDERLLRFRPVGAGWLERTEALEQALERWVVSQ